MLADLAIFLVAAGTLILLYVTIRFITEPL